MEANESERASKARKKGEREIDVRLEWILALCSLLQMEFPVPDVVIYRYWNWTI